MVIKSSEDVADDGNELASRSHVRPHRGGRPSRASIRYVDCGYEPELDVRGAAPACDSPARLSRGDAGAAYGDQPQAI